MQRLQSGDLVEVREPGKTTEDLVKSPEWKIDYAGLIEEKGDVSGTVTITELIGGKSLTAEIKGVNKNDAGEIESYDLGKYGQVMEQKYYPGPTGAKHFEL